MFRKLWPSQLELQSQDDPWRALRIHTYSGLLYQELVRNEAPEVTDGRPPIPRDTSDQQRITGEQAVGDDALQDMYSDGDDPKDRLLTRFEEAIEGLGVINDHLACEAARHEAPLIAHDLGLRYRKSLAAMDLANLTDAVDTKGVATNDLRSFHRADLVVEAADRQGDICYVAAEASRTVDSRDIARAIRNARLLREFTGRSSYAVVAGWGRDDRVRQSAEAGEVFWSELPAGAHRQSRRPWLLDSSTVIVR